MLKPVLISCLVIASCVATMAETTPTMATVEAIECMALGTVFIENTPLEFSLRAGTVPPSEYTVRDFWGKVVQNGKFPAAGKLIVSVLPPGYYALELRSDKCDFKGDKSFVIVTDPTKLKRNPESFFAMDTAQSWLCRADKKNTRFPGEAFELVSELCYLAGLSMVRERMSWGQVESPTHEYQWSQYARNADLLNSRGIKICGMFHDSPKWSRYPTGKERPGQTNMPDNLLATWRFTRTLAEKFKGKMTCWEFWNEADHHGHIETPWDFAAASKAAYLGFKAGNPELPVLSGSFCLFPMSGYADIYLANGSAEYFDIYNGHIYEPLIKYPETIAGIQQKLAANGIKDMQIYITENGTNAEGGCTISTRLPGIKAHSPEQCQLVAEFVPKSQIMLQSMGIARDFFFVLPPYSERDGIKDWGMLRLDYSAKPSFAAFANLTRQLSNAKYLGTYALGKDVRGFLYEQPDGSQTLAFWSLSNLDTGKGASTSEQFLRPIRIPAFGDCKQSDIFGKTETVTAKDGFVSVNATRYPAYLNGLKGIVPTVPASNIGKIGALKSGKDLTVVIKPYFSGDCKLGDARTAIDIFGEKCNLRLEVFNLSNQSKTGKIQVSGARLKGLPENITLSPMSKTVFETECTPDTNSGKGQCRLIVGGTFDTREITPLVVPLRSIKQMSDGPKVALDGENPKRWWNNTSGQMTLSHDNVENALRVDVKFSGPADRWIYPEYRLDLAKEMFADAVGIEFEMKIVNDTPGKNVGPSILMLVKDNEKEHGQAAFMKFPVPSAEWQKRIVFFDDSTKPEEIKMIRLGVNTKADTLTYWVRNVKIIRTRK